MAVGTAEKRAGKRGTKTRRAAADPPPDEPRRPRCAIGLIELHDSETQLLRVDQFERHPANRIPTPGAVRSLAESIGQLGQLEPIIARKVAGKEKYQILSGETRWLAHRLEGAVLIKARLIECTDPQALALVAEANSRRSDLRPIERARLIRELCRPEEEGGSGMSRAEAALVCGLESGSAASNLVRLLDAPQVWQDLLDTGWRIDGETIPCHEATVREIAKYGSCPELCAALAEQWRSFGYQPAITRDDQVRKVKNLIEFIARPLAGKRDYGWQLGEHPCLLELTPELRRKLQVVSAPLGKDGKEVEVALNYKLWDQLQQAAIKARGLDRESQEKAQKKPKQLAALSPKAQAAADAQRKKEAAEQLARWAKDWRYRLLRCELAERIDAAAAQWLVPWLISETARDYRTPIGQLLQYAAEGDQIPASDDVLTPLDTAIGRMRAGADGGKVLLQIARLLLWPADPNSHDLRTVARAIPERIPYLADEQIDQVAEALEVTLEEGWQAATVDGSAARELVAQLFSRHTAEQLDELADELGIGRERLPAAGKAARVADLLACHKAGAPLPLPRLLQEQRRRKAVAK